MTVKDIATQHGMTVQAVYKKIKTAGINLNALKDPKTGRFTPEGEEVILSLVENKKPPEAAENDLKQEVERLKLINEQLMKQVEILEQARDDLRNALNAAQVLQQQTLAKIPAALPAGEKHGLFSWLRRKNNNGEDV